MLFNMSLEGPPTAWKRPKSTRHGGKRFNPIAGKLRDARARILEQRPFAHPLTSQVHVELFFFFPRPQNHFLADGSRRGDAPEHYTGTGDVDNYVKFILDALHGVVVVNDKQVMGVSGIKKYADGMVGRTTIVVNDTEVEF